MITTYNFRLRDEKSENETAIYLWVRINGKTLKYPTKLTVNPKFWDSGKQRVKTSNSSSSELNGILSDMKATAENVFLLFQNGNKENIPSLEVYRDLLDLKFLRTEIEKPLTLNQIAEKYLDGFKNKVKDSSYKTYKQSMGNMMKFIVYKYGKQFEKKQLPNETKSLPIEKINDSFFDGFQTYLFDIRLATPETFRKETKNLKAFLKWGQDKKYFEPFKLVTQKNDTEESEAVYLDEDEIQRLFDLSLPVGTTIEVVRDYFILSCWTGLRFSDCTRLKSKNIKGDFIEIPTLKSNFKKTVMIPTHDLVRSILEKYKGELPQLISSQKTNEYLKEIAQKAGIDELVTLNTKRGRSNVITEQPKYELISFHCGRRSFCTNNYKRKIPTKLIMAISGHSKESTFYRYIRTTPEENATMMLKLWEEHKSASKLKIVG